MMTVRSLKALEAAVQSLHGKRAVRGEQRAGFIESLVGDFEEALACRAEPPGKRAVGLSGSLAAFLKRSLGRKPAGSVDRRDMHLWLSRLYQAMIRRSEALEHARLYHELCPDDSPLKQQAESWIFLAKACYWSDDQQGAVEYQRRGLDLLDEARRRGELTDRDERLVNKDCTVWAFRYAQNTCRWAEADHTFEAARLKALRWKDPAILCGTLILYAEAKMFQGDWQRCKKLGAECVKAALEVPGGPGSDYPFWIWGRALVHTGNPERALPELQRAVEIAVSIGDATGLAEVLVSLGEAHLALGNNAEALECAARAQKIAGWAGLGINLAQTRVWRAWIGMQIDPGSAPGHLGPIRRSVEDFERIGTLSGWACAVHALGHALMLSSRMEMARCYLEAAASAFRKYDMPWHEKRALESLAAIGR